MNILGIDYGRKKMGLALGDTESRLASPYKVVKVGSQKKAIEKIEKVVQVEKVEQVVVGMSEGEMGKETKEFGKKLEEKLKIPVIFQDETLTTQEAQKLSQEAGIGRKKRKKLEDAYSAALILQDYLDTH